MLDEDLFLIDKYGKLLCADGQFRSGGLPVRLCEKGLTNPVPGRNLVVRARSWHKSYTEGRTKYIVVLKKGGLLHWFGGYIHRDDVIEDLKWLVRQGSIRDEVFYGMLGKRYSLETLDNTHHRTIYDTLEIYRRF